jgi:hypothetical protein
MSANPPDKIEAAVKACLAFAAKRPSPFEAVADYIEMLRLLPSWTAEELTEVHVRAVEKLTGGNG